MNRFEMTALAKEKFIMEMLQDSDLVKCLRYPSADFLDKATGNPTDLLYTNIYPTKYVPEVHEDAKSYICMGFNYTPTKTDGRYYTFSYASFYMFCHKSIVRTNYGITRPDYMLTRVDDFVLGSRGEEWLGRMEFYDGGDEILDQNGNYVGVYARYRSVLLHDYR
ncbi:MAG: hypothetical protein J6S14_17285 [Clostridia bacterium]|nr:hypothetical protein [Clostridia bacterium]